MKGEMKKLPFGHFLENKKVFLDKLSSSANALVADTSRAKEEAVLRVLSRTGSSVIAEPGLGMNILSQNTGSSRDLVTIRQMLACGMHLGHSTSRWNPKMASYIYGKRAGIHIIDLEKTLLCLRQAFQVVKLVASKNGKIVFVGTSTPEIKRLCYEAATESNTYYVNERWLGGTITNRAQVLRDDRLLPDLLIVMDPKRNDAVLMEAKDACVPTIAICDTDCDPGNVTYPIPANDDAFASVELVTRALAAAAIEGTRGRSRASNNGPTVESASNFIERVFN